MLFFPESPRLLITTDQEVEDVRILKKLHTMA
jgi:hypothetical protein